MNEKQQILAALKEEYDRWQKLLIGLTEEQATASSLPSGWSIKDVVAHLWAWQLRSRARMEAALHNQQPKFPEWPEIFDPEIEEEPDQLNTWLAETYREKAWPDVHRDWQEGFLNLIELGQALPEQDLLARGKYAWLEEYPLAFILQATAEHHAEHREWLLAWLRDHPEQGIPFA